MKPKTFTRIFYTFFYTSFYTFCCAFLLCGCGIYSFTGAYTTAESIFVGSFLNRAGNGSPSLTIDFTEKLKEYYQRNTRLKIIDLEKDGQLVVTGSIVNYRLDPVAATANEAAQNRLTIGVEVNFTNRKEPKKNFKQNFSFYKNFPPNQTLTQLEGTSDVGEILDQIIQDIFTKTVADW